jgi:RNA-directed DNA polymerase
MSLIHELITHVGLGGKDIVRIIESAPARYKVYNIPKRKGGQRTIAQPSRELKLIQRFIVDAKLDVHKAAMAYVKRRNIMANATASHQQMRAILKLDFADFSRVFA